MHASQQNSDHNSTTGIAVVTVNYGTAELTMNGLETVRAAHHGGRHVEIHLVDNASPGDDATLFAREHAARGWGDQVVFYPEETNHGFAQGNNLVFRDLAARPNPPEYVFLLNPDAQLKNDVVSVLADFLDRHPKALCAGARIELPDGTPVTAAFRFPSPLGEFFRAVSFGPITRLAKSLEVPLPPDTPESKVDWVSGAAVMFRFETLKELNYFDPDYFLYFEELDLMHRARRAGYDVWHVPSAEVIHVEGAATNVKSNVPHRPRRPAYWYRSWRTYFIGNYGRSGARFAALAWMSGAALNHIIALLPGRQPAAPKHFFRDFWSLVCRPLLNLEERTPT